MRYWKPGAIFNAPCSKCGNPVEFFKDESTRKCPRCGHKMVNPRMDFGCAAYCQHAGQCLGDLPPELLAQRRDLLKDRVAVEMKRRFQRDFGRIGHAMKVARYAERIAKEEGGDMVVVLCSAYLHDIGLPEAMRKHGSDDAKYLEEEGPPVAREILTRLSADTGVIDEVCDIIGRQHHPRNEETVNFRIVHDADRIAKMEEKGEPADGNETAGIMENTLLTTGGRRLAGELLARAKHPERTEGGAS